MVRCFRMLDLALALLYPSMSSSITEVVSQQKYTIYFTKGSEKKSESPTCELVLIHLVMDIYIYVYIYLHVFIYIYMCIYM
jgi:hypothetical protein